MIVTAMFLPVEVDFTLTVVESGFVIFSLFVDVILVNRKPMLVNGTSGSGGVAGSGR